MHLLYSQICQMPSASPSAKNMPQKKFQYFIQKQRHTRSFFFGCSKPSCKKFIAFGYHKHKQTRLCTTKGNSNCCLRNTCSSPSLQPLGSQTLSIIPATEKYENQVNITNTESPVHSQESKDVKMILMRPINC